MHAGLAFRLILGLDFVAREGTDYGYFLLTSSLTSSAIEARLG